MVIALVMLLVLTLLATASARMTLLEERMTGNTQDRNVAFQAAEAALRFGEQIAQASEVPVFGGANAGLYKPADPDDAPVWEALDWKNSAAVHADADLDVGGRRSWRRKCRLHRRAVAARAYAGREPGRRHHGRRSSFLSRHGARCGYGG